MNIKQLDVTSLHPYEFNTKKHTKKQINQVASSIKEFGFVQPIVVDKDGVIVIGHCRFAAAQQLGMEKVPAVIADDLTEEQINALRIVDNKVNESEWDFDNLSIELNMLDFDFGDFDIDFGNIDEIIEEQEAQHKENKEKTQEMVENIINLGYGQYYSDNKEGFPCVAALRELPEVEQWIPFHHAMQEKHPENKGVLFFCDDYRFERVWNNPSKYIDLLKRFKCVISTDFSLYYDTPLVIQKFNQYRNRWLACYWQENGISVIPLVRGSGDYSSFEFYLDGLPKHSWLAFSAMWDDGDMQQETIDEFNTAVQELEPIGILLYGGSKGWEERYKANCPIVHVDKYKIG